MATIKTFRVNGELAYNDIDDNWDNLNAAKIERVVTVNDAQTGLAVTQNGAGKKLTVNTDKFVVAENNKVGIGTATPTADLDVVGNGAVRISSGSTAQRPATPEKGLLRFNETTDQLEYGNGTRWRANNGFKLKIDKIIGVSYNNFWVLGEGELYVCTGTNGTWPVYNNSQTDNYLFSLGLNSMYRVIIPESSPIVDGGHNGANNAFALLANGNLYTWGANTYGSLGTGAAVKAILPTLVQTGVTKVYTTPSQNSVYSEYNRMVIQKADGYLYGAGWNGQGALGISNTTDQASFVQLTGFGQNPKGVWNLGGNYGCLFVQRADGKLFASGYNGYGQLGNGNTTTNTSPIDVTGGWLNNNTFTTVKSVSGFFGYHSGSQVYSYCTIMVVSDDGTNTLVKVGGDNSNYQLGDGTTTTRTTPITLSFPARVKEARISGCISGYALLENGNLYAWGYNGYGQLGTTPASVTTPTIVQNNVDYLPMPDWNAYTHGYYAGQFIVKTDGYLYASGYNGHGQMCIGSAASVTGFTKCQVPAGPGNRIKSVAMWASTGTGVTIVAQREDDELFAWGYNGQVNIEYSNSQSNFYTARNFKIKRT